MTNDTFTKMSNQYLDKIMHKLSIAENVMVNCLSRKIHGFNKKEAYISTSEFIRMTGLSKTTVIKCIKSLVEKNIITKEKTSFGGVFGKGINRFFFNHKTKHRSKEGVHHSTVDLHHSTGDVHIKENNLNKTTLKKTNINTAVVEKNDDDSQMRIVDKSTVVKKSSGNLQNTPINHLLVLSGGNDIFKRSNAVQRLAQTSKLKSILKDYDYGYVFKVMMYMLKSDNKEARWWVESGNFNFKNFYKFTQIYRNDVLNKDHDDDRFKYIARCIDQFFLRFGIKKGVEYIRPVAKTTYEITIQYSLDIFDKAIARMFEKYKDDKELKKNNFLIFDPTKLESIIKDIEYTQKKEQKEKQQEEQEMEQEIGKENKVSFEDINLNIFISLTLDNDIQYQKKSYESQQSINKDLIKLISKEDIVIIGKSKSYKLNELHGLKNKYKDQFKNILNNN